MRAGDVLRLSELLHARKPAAQIRRTWHHEHRSILPTANPPGVTRTACRPSPATRHSPHPTDHDRVHPAPGAEAGAPRIVLVHSLALDRSVWNGVAERLGAARSAGIRLPRPWPVRPPQGRYSAESFAGDLAELLDHVGWEGGGRRLLDGRLRGTGLCRALPRRSPALGLIDTTAWYGADAPQSSGARRRRARKGMRGLVDFQLTRWFSDEYRAANPPAMNRPAALFVANDFDCYAASCALLGDVDAGPYLSSLPHAGRDRRRRRGLRDAGRHGAATPRGIPQSTLTVLPRARHLTPIEHPELIATELLALLRRVSP